MYEQISFMLILYYTETKMWILTIFMSYNPTHLPSIPFSWHLLKSYMIHNTMHCLYIYIYIITSSCQFMHGEDKKHTKFMRSLSAIYINVCEFWFWQINRRLFQSKPMCRHMDILSSFHHVSHLHPLPASQHCFKILLYLFALPNWINGPWNVHV